MKIIKTNVLILKTNVYIYIIKTNTKPKEIMKLRLDLFSTAKRIKQKDYRNDNFKNGDEMIVDCIKYRSTKCKIAKVIENCTFHWIVETLTGDRMFVANYTINAI